MFSLYPLLKPLLFRLEPEKAHRLTMRLLSASHLLFSDQKPDTSLATTLFGRKIRSPLMLAAGFDKEATMFPLLARLGFGGAELGTFTLKPQAGNPQPRVFRIPEQQALINRMGFNNPGFTKGFENFIKRYRYCPADFLTALSLGKGKDTPPENAADEYRHMLQYLKEQPLPKTLSYVALNISSPNTPGLRSLQKTKLLKRLIQVTVDISPLPIAVKLAPDFANDREFTDTIKAATDAGAQGIIVHNTSTDFSSLLKIPEGVGTLGGGLSGEPLVQKSRHLLRQAVQAAKGQITIISSGGVMSPAEAKLRLDEGADAVQVYTGLIYYGPQLIRDTNRLLMLS